MVVLIAALLSACGRATPSTAEHSVPRERGDDAGAHAATALHATAEKAPPVPGGMKDGPLANAFAYIPPQCYARTPARGGVARGGCYVCHQASQPPNFADDGALQLDFSLLPRAAAKNPWKNLFAPAVARVAGAAEANVDASVRTSNYFDSTGAIILARRLRGLPAEWDGQGDGHWDGFIPDAWFRFDDGGFDRAPDGTETGWRAFAYYPLPGAFLPTNGSLGDVLIRLDPLLREDAQGRLDPAVYRANLAIIEALITRRDVPIDPVDESSLGTDLDLDGRLGRADHVAFDAGADGSGKTRMHYAGAARIHEQDGQFPLEPGLFPLGTEFLHSLRYLDVAGDGGVVMAPRMKELRYAKKVRWLSPADLKAKAAAEPIEQAESPSGARNVIWEFDRGVFNGEGWLLQGFIEAADGSLRPQSYQETVFCVGCHGGVGATTDGTFAFARKLGAGTLARGWFHWTQHDLRGLREPRRRDGEFEYEFYLRQNGAADDFRDNDEARRRFFDESGRPKPQALSRLREDVSFLLLPSPERAAALDRAYLAVVRDQSFALGRDPVLGSVRDAYEVVPEGAKTGIRAPVRSSALE
jgi:hypothetical protein